MVNSRLGHVAAAPSSSGSKSRHSTGAPLLPKLRGHFAEFLNEGSLDHLGMLYQPTCVGFGTGAFPLPRGFSRGHGFSDFGLTPSTSPLGLSWAPDFPGARPTGLSVGNHRHGSLTLPRPPFGVTRKTRYRNINLLAIAYAFRPRLRSRLTLSRLALLRKPWAYGERASHPLYRYSCQHGHLCNLHMISRPRFCDGTTLSYHLNKFKSEASVLCFSPDTFSAQIHSTSELLRFL